jgi:phage shock protein PspC (stress-responsive transcriptional regulator)
MPQVPPSLSEELSALETLHQRGAISSEEYAQAKRRLLDAPQAGSAPDVTALTSINALRRSRGDRWIAGVCGGLAKVTGAESWIWRLMFVVFCLFGGAGILLYALLWIFVPVE